jgi:hypothetical protein
VREPEGSGEVERVERADARRRQRLRGGEQLLVDGKQGDAAEQLIGLGEHALAQA